MVIISVYCLLVFIEVSEILVLQYGYIVQCGCYEVLVVQFGWYCDMY